MNDIIISHTVIVIMGVTGSGKTTVSYALAEHLRFAFIEGDSFHPTENINKLSAGIPLTDDDRFPWLRLLNKELQEAVKKGGAVLSCSALKKCYRDLLCVRIPRIMFVLLEGSKQELADRLKQRKDHFMNPNLLQSQLEIMEYDGIDLIVPVSLSISETILQIEKALFSNFL